MDLDFVKSPKRHGIAYVAFVEFGAEDIVGGLHVRIIRARAEQQQNEEYQQRSVHSGLRHITAGMSGVASPMALARRRTKLPDVIHTPMLTEEYGHDRSIPWLDRILDFRVEAKLLRQS